jgi:hypothetical protein
MAISFADLGFWRVATISFALELLHLILQGHWPAIRGSKLGRELAPQHRSCCWNSWRSLSLSQRRWEL